MLLGPLVRGAGIHRFRDLAAAGPSPKGVILGDVLLPKIDAKSTSKWRVQNVDFGARGVFGTGTRKPTFSDFGPGAWRCENTTPVVRDACHGARTRYIRELARELVLGTFSMKSQRGQDPRNQVGFVPLF